MDRIKNSSISLRINMIVVAMGILAVAMGLLGHWSVATVAEHFHTAYQDRVVPVGQLSSISRILANNRSILLSVEGQDATAVAASAKQLEGNAAKASELWKGYSATYLTPEEKVLADQFVKSRSAWLEKGLKPAADAMKRGDAVLARRIASEHSSEFDQTTDDLEALVDLQMQVINSEYAGSIKTLERTDWILGLSLAAGLALGGFAAWAVARTITRPIGQIVNTMAELERERDLTLRVQIDSRDECGRLGAAFNGVMSSLESALGEVKRQSAAVSASATELAGAARTMLESSGAQSEATSSTAAAVEQLAVSVSHVAQSAAAAAELADHAAQTSRQGEVIVQTASQEMARIADDVRASATLAHSLSARSNDISGIVQVIKDVAEQTNLLALNAAIEAARAGEQGRGFAVVADEVRKLAERTAGSTAQITTLIQQVQSDTRSVVGTMESSLQKVASGVEHSGSAGESLGRILEGTLSTQGKMAEIASATKEQSTASNDIARHVEKIAQMTEENSAVATQASGLAGRLEEAASALRAQVDRFKTA